MKATSCLRVVRARLRPRWDMVVDGDWAFLQTHGRLAFNWVDLRNATLFEDHDAAAELLRMELYLDDPSEYVFEAVAVRADLVRGRMVVA